MNATVLLTSVDINIPGYRILRPIGEGGMASVFLAMQESLEREVALKVMSPALASNGEFAGRFLTEGKITAKLQHPNLVTVYDIGTHAGVYYLAAEYIPGGTLRERISQGGLSVAQVLDIASDIASGLDFAHQKGFVHRDVKPANVLFRTDGRVVLADFGIAKALDGSSSATVAGASIGTPDYMSPEQARGESVDGRSDLYSLGVVLYEMLAGQAPYQAGDPFTVALMHVTHPLPELPEKHAWLQPLVHGLMAKDPAMRFRSGAAFVEAVQRVVAEAPAGAIDRLSDSRQGTARLSGAAATQQRTRVSMREDTRRPRWPWLAGGTALVAAAAAWWMLGREAPVPTQTASNPPAANLPAGTDTDPPLPEGFQAPQPIDADSGMEVERLLNAGDQLLEDGTPKEPGRKLASPEDDSALGYYRRALALDPDNARARAGIANIVAFYRSYSFRLCELGRWVQCGIIVRTGLDVDPQDAYLLQMHDAARQGEEGGNPVVPPAPAG